MGGTEGQEHGGRGRGRGRGTGVRPKVGMGCGGSRLQCVRLTLGKGGQEVQAAEGRGGCATPYVGRCGARFRLSGSGPLRAACNGPRAAGGAADRGRPWAAVPGHRNASGNGYGNGECGRLAARSTRVGVPRSADGGLAGGLRGDPSDPGPHRTERQTACPNDPNTSVPIRSAWHRLMWLHALATLWLLGCFKAGDVSA